MVLDFRDLKYVVHHHIAEGELIKETLTLDV